MATKVLMPQLGESVTEGTIAKWLVQKGDFVNKYDALAEVNTDKVTAEVPSTVSGRIQEILIAEGETVSVGTLMMYIVEEGENETSENSPEVTKQTEQSFVPETTGKQPEMKRETINQIEKPTQQGSRGKVRYSPAVMTLAQEHGIDLSLVMGTGIGGRITRKDVEKAVQEGVPAPTFTQGVNLDTEEKTAMAYTTAGLTQEDTRKQNAVTQAKAQPVPIGVGDQEIPITPVRRTIANRMVQSKQEAPHAWMMVEVDATNLVKLREVSKDEFKRKEGFSLTYLPFFIKAVVEALKEFPMMNSSWSGDKIIMHKNINISLAVATDNALFVPVIKDTDQKSIYGIAKSIEGLAQKTRAGKLSIDDMAGGTFTVNNTGTFGSILSQPIINAPQAAIMSVEAIVKRPVVIDDMIAVRSMVNLCLSLDHRVLDGLICGQFMQSVKRKVEGYGAGTSIY
ncbi:dihydrolipoamide acetyltransferase family protein [Brevibacillus daliensis]|uniref:dihydrolipoamide acetyltransferase family protein n=1 Tax=Brevibacillus daliensis TaxID=2892995 RepID=UPI001E3F9441|nr:dihydrolipoamide acetyltransferase family protein [Brevibacillus daliensis]